MGFKFTRSYPLNEDTFRKGEFLSPYVTDRKSTESSEVSTETSTCALNNSYPDLSHF